MSYLNHPDVTIRKITYKEIKNITKEKGSSFILRPGYLQGLCEINSKLYRESCSTICHALTKSNLDDIEETIIIKLLNLLINSLRSEKKKILSDALKGIDKILNWGGEKARKKNLDKNPLLKEIHENALSKVIEEVKNNWGEKVPAEIHMIEKYIFLDNKNT